GAGARGLAGATFGLAGSGTGNGLAGLGGSGGGGVSSASVIATGVDSAGVEVVLLKTTAPIANSANSTATASNNACMGRCEEEEAEEEDVIQASYFAAALRVASAISVAPPLRTASITSINCCNEAVWLPVIVTAVLLLSRCLSKAVNCAGVSLLFSTKRLPSV